MKATIDVDDALYRRLKIEAARRNRTIRDMIAEGIHHVLATPALDVIPVAEPRISSSAESTDTALPPWFGILRKYAANANGAHDLASMRRSVAEKRPRHESW